MGTENSEPMVDTAQLEASLNELTRAAQATALVKGEGGDGVAISRSPHWSDGKPGSGEAISMGDTGTIDELQVAKMTQAGVDAGTIANFRAFMRAKAEGDPPPDADLNNENPEAMRGQAGSGILPNSRPNPGGGAMGKSMDAFRKDRDMEQAFDVSPFLEALVAKTATQIDLLNKSLVTGQQGQTKFNRAMAGAVVQMGNLLKSRDGVITELGRRLQIVERAPAQPARGATGDTNVRPLNKSMLGERGQQPQQLTKSMVARTLTYMNLEKSIRQLPDGRPTGQTASLIEAGGDIDPTALGAAQSFLSQNPNEAHTALNYA